jgi:D-alanyl-D-alanine carboxypeptidase
MKSNILLVSFIVLIVGISGCDKVKDKFAPDSKVFKVDIFRANLQTQLNGALGYAFVINKDGQWVDSTSFGIGGTNPTGGGNISASVLHDINIASVTKPLTCIAAIKLMEQKGIDIDDQIGVWLPSYWAKSTSINTTTFRQLLTHTSNIQQSSTSWDSLKATASRPLTGPNTFVYANANFALFRALLPKMNDLDGFNAAENNSSGFETWMSNQYISIMQDLVFTPAGLANITCRVNPGKTTMQAMNEVNNPPLIVRSSGDWTETCGGGGYYLTTMEMAQVMAYLAHTGGVLTGAQKTLMDDNLLGWDPNDSFTSTHGKVFGKDGALFWDNDNDGNVSGGDSGLQTWVGKFPNGVELALSITLLAATGAVFQLL